MVMRINIGSTTYSATPTSGITFLADSKDGPTADPELVKFRFGTEGAELPFYIHCSAANVAALKAVVDGVVAVINGSDLFDDVSVDNGSSGSVLAEFKTSDGTYRNRAGETSVEWWGETEAFITARIIFSNVTDFARGGGGAGAEQFVDGLIEAQCERNVGGYLQVVLSALFRPTQSTNAMDAAQDWVAAIIGRSSAPTQVPWLPAKDVLRTIDNFFETLQHDSANDTQDRVRATIVLREIDPQLTTAAAEIKAIDFDVSQRTQNIPERYNPGWEAAITGQLQYKRAGLSSFDSNDSAPGYITQANAVVALNIVIAAAKARQGWTNFVPVDVTLTHGGSQGVYGFSINGIADGSVTPVLTVTEHLVERQSDLTFIDTDTSGAKWNYGIGDKLRTFVHRLEVVRVGSPDVYQKPAGIPENYSTRETSQDTLTPVSQESIGLTAGGQVKYATTWEVVYEDFTGERQEGVQSAFGVRNNTQFGIGRSLSGN